MVDMESTTKIFSICSPFKNNEKKIKKEILKKEAEKIEIEKSVSQRLSNHAIPRVPQF